MKSLVNTFKKGFCRQTESSGLVAVGKDTAHDHIFCVTLWLHCELDGELLGELDGELCLAHLILALPCQLIKMLQQ